jgi:hypothetical protein
MYLESLLRLAQTVGEFNEKGEKLISEEYHKETADLIKAQTEFLVEELKFKQNNPGPYDFGFGDLTMTIFSPEQTDVQEWAVIARKNKWQKNYRFNSIMGLVKVLSLIVEESNKDNEEEDKDK